MARSARPNAARDVEGTHVWLVLRKTFRAVARHAERSVATNQLILSDFVVLEILLNRGDQRVNDIGRRVGMTSGAITSAIDRLETRGLVVRAFDPDDRRARIVQLTPGGRLLIVAAFKRHAKAMEKAVAALDARERTTLVDLMKKLGLAADASFTEMTRDGSTEEER